ncbi:methyl-accepting chemotaxis protein [Paenibacillus sp. sgz302251]|uniref:methyl-accepting chemotaxis protein n=1 Tax=Paenibacillus sp. sgz302251 TaxID=3414493 RepID=UPI003C7C5E45
MKWFYNLKTSVKLISAFVLMAILLAFVGIFGLSNMGKINDEVGITYNERLVPIADIAASQVLYQQIRVNIRDMNFIAIISADKNIYENNINELKNQILTNMDTYRNSDLSEQEREVINKFDPAWESYNEMLELAMQSAHAGDIDEYKRIAPDFKAAGDQVEGVLMELISLNITTAQHGFEQSNAMYEGSRTMTITIIIVSLLFSIAFGYFMSQIIARPLNRLVGLLGKVAAGDLRETSDINTRDEIGQLATSINNMVISLRSTVGAIFVSAESVAAASQQISSSTEEIARGSNSQASDAQTMNELFSELSIAISSVAQSAEQAADLSNTTMDIAMEGGKVVRSSIEGMVVVNEQMSRLEEDSNKIGEIIEVIDDIAEQTNLLALNAAIEAARAGEQGRGFAVVADEVRKLAERSSEATKQITSIIKGMQQNTQHSVRAVGEGVAFSKKTGEAFDSIITMVNQSALKVTEIAAASEEQAAQSAEVLISIESISAATQQSAASSEETAATALSLAELAQDLNSSVSIFNIK